MKGLIKKGDQVIVTVGKCKGEKGEVLRVSRETSRCMVKGVNMVMRHQKPNALHPKGGILRKEAFIHLSNVMHVDPKTQKPTRVGIKFLEGGKRVLTAKKSGEEIRAVRK